MCANETLRDLTEMCILILMTAPNTPVTQGDYLSTNQPYDHLLLEARTGTTATAAESMTS